MATQHGRFDRVPSLLRPFNLGQPHNIIQLLCHRRAGIRDGHVPKCYNNQIISISDVYPAECSSSFRAVVDAFVSDRDERLAAAERGGKPSAAIDVNPER